MLLGNKHTSQNAHAHPPSPRQHQTPTPTPNQKQDRPIIFPLSNPTDQSECTFEQALAWTGGRALFASGSPFPPARDPASGLTRHPAQANNVYVFPAVGHAAVATKARMVTDEMFVVAAEELAGMTSLGDVEAGR